MSKWMVLSISMAFVLAAALAGCGGESATSGGGAAGGAGEPTAAPAEPAAPQPAAPAQPAAAQPAAAEPAADAAAADASGIVGTKWKMGDISFSFEKDGVLKVNDMLPGTWKLDGGKLTVEAMGQSYEAEWKDGKVVYDGQELALIQ